MILPRTFPIELSALTAELKAVVPSVSGCVLWPTTLEVFTEDRVEFSAGDQVRLQHAAAAHNAIAIRAARATLDEERLTNPMRTMTLAQAEAQLTAITDLAGVKLFVRRLTRYLIAQRG